MFAGMTESEIAASEALLRSIVSGSLRVSWVPFADPLEPDMRSLYIGNRRARDDEEGMVAQLTVDGFLHRTKLSTDDGDSLIVEPTPLAEQFYAP